MAHEPSWEELLSPETYDPQRSRDRAPASDGPAAGSDGMRQTELPAQGQPNESASGFDPFAELFGQADAAQPAAQPAEEPMPWEPAAASPTQQAAAQPVAASPEPDPWPIPPMTGPAFDVVDDRAADEPGSAADPFAELFASQPAAAAAPAGAIAAAAGPTQPQALSRRDLREREGRSRTTQEPARPVTSDAGAGGGRRGRGSDGGEGKRRRARWPRVVFPILLVLGLGAGAAWYVWSNYEPQVRELLGWELPNDFEGTGNGEEVVVTIKAGDIGEDVARTLHDAGVTMTFDAFYDLLLDQSENVNFIPGNYSLEREMSAQSALDALLDPANKITDRLLITEGTTLDTALAILAETTGIPIEEFETAAADPQSFGVPAEAPSLEGYLFPATYELDGGQTARDLIQLLVNTMFERLDKAGVAPEDRHRVLTMAALIQREAGPNTDDFYKISRVFQNRLDQGMRLESDATVAYGTGNLGTVWTTDAERADASNLYNTYANDGLPIGPIGAPGELAIDAALNPADGPWLFFVPINLATGETAFSTTANEHEANVAKLRAWCRASTENASYCE